MQLWIFETETVLQMYADAFFVASKQKPYSDVHKEACKTVNQLSLELNNRGVHVLNGKRI